jgi:hypothetical protein
MSVVKEARRFKCTKISGFVSHPCGTVIRVLMP